MNMEITREESKRVLRRIELEAYSALVTALRAQGELDRQKKKLLRELGEQLSISTERHRAEIRRAISDDRLSMIAECVCGSDASVEWESEGRRVVPLMPRLVPQTAFTGTATAAANHAATVNSTIPSTTKRRPKEIEEDFLSRKRQRTNSSGTIQKVIVSSAPKTTTTTVRNPTTKDPSRFLKTTSPAKQETNQSSVVSIKMTSSQSGSSGVSSKPIILGGSKSSSVSVAPSKYVAPLPASCLQAHASVVSGNKNRLNVNVVKPKPKPKFKPMAASVKIKSVSSGHGTAVGSSIVQTVAQSLLSAAKIKGNDGAASSTTSKTVQVSRSTSTITVAPRSSISLTTFKTTLQPKQSPQSTPGTVRTVEGISRQNPSQIGKAVSVSRLSRPLPAILPKTIPPKALTAVSSPGRKLAPILPAPAKSTTSTLPNPLVVPVVVSSSTTSSPISIAPSPRPPQSFTAGLASSVMNKVTTVSTTTGQSADTKRDTQDPSITSSEVNTQSPVLFGKSPVGSQNSSPMSSKSLDNIHEREALSPVSEILTLVTSPSSVPFVPSSPVKSLPTTVTAGEISLECEENLIEDLIKDNVIGEKEQTRPLVQLPPSLFTQTQGKTGLEVAKDVVSSSNSKNVLALSSLTQALRNVRQDIVAVTGSTYVGHLSQEDNKNKTTTQLLKDSLISFDKTSDLVSKPIDLSPLVDELISDDPFSDTAKKQFDSNLGGSDLVPSNATTSDDIKCDMVADNSENNLFIPVLDLDINLSNVPETVETNVGELIRSVDKGDENVIKQSIPVAKHTEKLKTNSDVLQQDIAATGQQDSVVDSLATKEREELADELKKEICSHSEVVPSETSEQAELNPLKVNKPKQGEKQVSLEATGEQAKSNQNVSLKDTDKLRDDIITTSVCIEAVGEQSLSKKSKEDEKALSGFQNNAENVGTSANVTADTTSRVSADKTSRNITNKTQASCETSVNTSGENKIIAEETTQLDVSGNNFGSEVKSVESKIFTTNQTNEIVKTYADEKRSEDNVIESVNKDNVINMSPAQAEEGCVTETQPHEDTQGHSSKDEEQLSGSEIASLEGNLVRTSNRKRKAPPPRDLSAHPPGWLRGALQLLQKVSRFRGSSRSKNARNAASWFLKPVATSEAPGYHKVIKCPMDFGTIKTKLEAGEYAVPADFNRDMLLVKSNCCKYNPPGHVVRKDCDEIFQFYEAEYEKFVERLDKVYLPTPKKQKASPV